MITNEIVSPYFENGAFSGVRVTLEDEDFVIAPKDFRNGKEMDWQSAMDALKANGLDTWDYRQICHTMAYRNEIDRVLTDNGGDSLIDLFFDTKKHEGWLPIYKTISGDIIPGTNIDKSEKDAIDRSAPYQFATRIKVIKIEWEE